MKYILLLAFIIITFIGCREQRNNKGEIIPDEHTYIIRYNGCQYVRFDIGHDSWGGHSGTCDNPIHSTK